MTSRTILAEPVKGGYVWVFVRPDREIAGFHPWVLVAPMKAPEDLPPDCVPVTVREYGPPAYDDVLSGKGTDWT